MKRIALTLIIIAALPTLANSVNSGLAQNKKTPIHHNTQTSASCYTNLTDSPLLAAGSALSYTGKLEPKCKIQISLKSPEILLESSSYLGNFCITSLLTDSSCSNTNQSDGFSIGPLGSDRAPDTYTNGPNTRYLRMYDCQETINKNGKPLTKKVDCSSIFKIESAQ